MIMGSILKRAVFYGMGGFVFAGLLALMVYSPSKPLEVKSVDSSLVCMGTDQVPGKAMIPIEIEGRTYYGCCPNCNERLRTDKRVRMATDPVSGEAVDKALAFIVEGSGGRALYFKSAETAKKYLENIGKIGESKLKKGD